MKVTPDQFYTVLVEFVQSLSSRFPENEGAKKALIGLELFGSETYYPTMSKMWADLSAPIVADIVERKSAKVVEAFDNCEVDVIANIKAGSILENPDVDEATKSAIWDYIDNLTAMAAAVQNPEVVKEPAAPAPAPVAAPVQMRPPSHPVVSQGMQPIPGAQVPAPAPRPAAPPVKDIIKGISSSLPDIISGLNDVLKTNGMEGDNPVMDMVKQMMNPGAVQTGMAPNMMALATGQGQQPPAMAEAADSMGMSVDEIQKKLARLENFEKARAKRKNARS